MSNFKWLTVYDIKGVFKISENIPEADIEAAVSDAYNFDMLTTLPDSMFDDIKSILEINPIQWSSNKSYVVGNKVFFDGVYYNCLVNNTDSEPSASNTDWEVIELMQFWLNYVKPFFISKAYSRFFLWHGANVTQYGTTEVIGEERQSISAQKKAELMADIDGKCDIYLGRLTKYFKNVNQTFDGTLYELDTDDSTRLDSQVKIWGQKGIKKKDWCDKKESERWL